MSLPRFFLETQVIAQETEASFLLELAADDAKHFRVLRLGPGEHIAVVDGASDYFECRIEGFEGNVPVVSVARHVDSPMQRVRVTLCQGLAKGDKMDTVIRHSTELGVSSFMPFSSKRSIVKLDEKKARTRTERWRSIAKSAAMQSGQMPFLLLRSRLRLPSCVGALRISMPFASAGRKLLRRPLLLMP